MCFGGASVMTVSRARAAFGNMRLVIDTLRTLSGFVGEDGLREYEFFVGKEGGWEEVDGLSDSFACSATGVGRKLARGGGGLE